MIMMAFGLYEKAILAISNYFDDVWGHTKFLTIIGSGVLMSVILISKLIILLFLNYYFLVICFFGGLILGGTPFLFKEVKGTLNKVNLLIFFFCLLLVFSLSLVDSNKQLSLHNFNNNFFLLFLIGVIEAFTMIIPGISGTAILIILGLYHILLELFGSLSKLSLFLTNVKMFFPFSIGLISGGIICVKIIDYLLKNYKIQTYWGIIGLAFSSIFLMLSEVIIKINYLKELLMGLFLLIIGYSFSSIFEKKVISK